MAITRTPIIDDDGTGRTGTAIDNAWKQEFYNQIDGALVALPAPTWSAYVPTWYASSVTPVLGNGTITGTYAVNAGLTYFELILTMGSTSSFGAGTWNLSTPSTIVTPASYRGMLIVTGRAYDASAGASTIVAGAVPLSAVNFETYSYTGALGPTLPFIWASGDILQVAGCYRST